MGRNRDLIKEIDERRSRLSFGSDRYSEFSARIKSISRSHDSIVQNIEDESVKKELLRYIPISLVSAMEGYFRAAVRDLVDSDIVFLERIEGYKELKIPINIVTAVHGKKLPLGEFVSHSLQLSSPDHINKNLSLILDIDFYGHMRSADFSFFGEGGNLVNADDELFSGIYKSYELRNIYCHEMAHSQEIEFFDALWGILSVENFVGYSEIILMAEINSVQDQS